MAAKPEGDNHGDKRPKIEVFDDIYAHIGDAGRYQLFLFFLLIPFSLVYAIVYFGQYFMVLIPEEHWCRVPEFENTNLSDWERIELSIPAGSQDASNVESHVSFSRCTMYLANYTEVLMTRQKPKVDTPIGNCQFGWSYNMSSVPYRSIGAELDWVCSQSYLGNAAQSAFFAGSMVGGMMFGYGADRFGRLPALVACNALGFFASIATSFTTTFWTFTISRIIVGLSFDSCFSIAFIIVMEYVGPKYRTLATNMSFGVFFAIGTALVPWIAYWVSDWRLLSLVYAIPLVVAFVSPWVVPESARWYVQKGRVKEAVEVLKKFARINKKEVPDSVFEEFERSCEKATQNDKSHDHTLLDLFKLPRLRRIVVILVLYWVFLIFILDGHVWNMQLLHPNVFVSFSLAALSELPASIVVTLLLDKWGRRWMGFSLMLVCGVFSFVALGMPHGPWALSMGIIARLGVNGAGNVAYQFAAELLPTVVRGQGVSLIHIVGCVAHFLAAYLVYLANFNWMLPLIILGSLSFAVAAMTLSLPETLGEEMPETLEEGNEFGRDQRFWWMPCINGSQKKRKRYRQKNLGSVNAGFEIGSSDEVRRRMGKNEINLTGF